MQRERSLLSGGGIQINDVHENKEDEKEIQKKNATPILDQNQRPTRRRNLSIKVNRFQSRSRTQTIDLTASNPIPPRTSAYVPLSHVVPTTSSSRMYNCTILSKAQCTTSIALLQSSSSSTKKREPRVRPPPKYASSQASTASFPTIKSIASITATTTRNGSSITSEKIWNPFHTSSPRVSKQESLQKTLPLSMPIMDPTSTHCHLPLSPVITIPNVIESSPQHIIHPTSTYPSVPIISTPKRITAVNGHLPPPAPVMTVPDAEETLPQQLVSPTSTYPNKITSVNEHLSPLPSAPVISIPNAKETPLQQTISPADKYSSGTTISTRNEITPVDQQIPLKFCKGGTMEVSINS
ncbi:hypothetical protein QAD02_007575 [Eretmocerus hayati]|uniref:Uncharacterized protein n=1 Tax=Eretmocerus hayati TaxID=131215 RepID=A0ACC2N5A4_9HYME|nr:hypothetical protein QAD02_007575 [Eretmocerus hayati]